MTANGRDENHFQWKKVQPLKTNRSVDKKKLTFAKQLKILIPSMVSVVMPPPSRTISILVIIHGLFYNGLVFSYFVNHSWFLYMAMCSQILLISHSPISIVVSIDCCYV